MQEPRYTQTVVVADEPIVDFTMLGHYLRFMRNSFGRQPRLFWLTWLIGAMVSFALAIWLPRVYQINTRILTHKASMMPALVNPDRSIPQTADNPTAGAEELIKSRENLEKLIHETALEKLWDQKRGWVYKAKDNVMKKLLGSQYDLDKHEAFLKLLDERIVAKVSDDVIAMQVEWPDPAIAMSLAEGLIKRFRSLRHDMELGEIQETIQILEHSVETSRAEIEETVKSMAKIFAEKEKDLAQLSGRNYRTIRKRRVVAIRKPQGAQAEEPQELTLVRRQLIENQEKINAIKQSFQSGLKAAEEELDSLQANLGPSHPDVLDAKRRVNMASVLPPELALLQAKQNQLNAQLSKLSGDTMKRAVPLVKVEDETSTVDDQGSDLMRFPVTDELSKQLDDDPEIGSIMEEIKKKESEHDSVLRRLHNARIEKETAEIAFDYRYIVTLPPVYPQKYIKPNIPMVLGGGLIMAMLLALALCVSRDLLGRKILESWQVEAFLKVRVLGEIDQS